MEWETKQIPVPVRVCIDDGEPMDADAQLSQCISFAMGDIVTRLSDMTEDYGPEHWPVDNLQLTATVLLDLAAALKSWKSGEYEKAHVIAAVTAWRTAEWAEPPPEPVATDPATQ